MRATLAGDAWHTSTTPLPASLLFPPGLLPRPGGFAAMLRFVTSNGVGLAFLTLPAETPTSPALRLAHRPGPNAPPREGCRVGMRVKSGGTYFAVGPGRLPFFPRPFCCYDALVTS